MPDIRACQACGMLQAYPMPLCRACHGTAFIACAPLFEAEVYSRTTVHRAPNPEWQASVPYTVALLRGPQGGLLLVRLAQDVPIGAKVTVVVAAGALTAIPSPTP